MPSAVSRLIQCFVFGQWIPLSERFFRLGSAKTNKADPWAESMPDETVFRHQPFLHHMMFWAYSLAYGLYPASLWPCCASPSKLGPSCPLQVGTRNGGNGILIMQQPRWHRFERCHPLPPLQATPHAPNRRPTGLRPMPPAMKLFCWA